MSIGDNWTNYGDRIAYIHPTVDNSSWITSPINGDPNGGVLLFSSPPVGEWCSVEVVHQVEEGEYVYNVSINGVVKHSTKNSEPSEFSDVLVYAYDPWNPAQASHIRALTIQTIMVSEPENFSYSHFICCRIRNKNKETSTSQFESVLQFLIESFWKKANLSDIKRVHTAHCAGTDFR